MASQTGVNSELGIYQTVQTSLIILWICVGVTLSEQASLLKFDWSLITGQRRRRAVQLAYLGAKLSWWAYVAVNIVTMYAAGPLHCQGQIIAIETTMSFIAFFSSVLLAARTVCVYQGKARTIVTVIVTIGALAVLAVWLAGVNDVQFVYSEPGAWLWQPSGCGPGPVKKVYFVKYLITILYDLMVLMLTTFGVVRMSAAGSSRIGSILVEQGLVYFIVTFLANLLVMIFTLIPTLPAVWNLFWAVPSSAVCVTASTRLYVKLAEAASTNTHQSSDGQVRSGSSASEKFINFLSRNKRNGGIPGVHSSATQSGSAGVKFGSSSSGSYGVAPAPATSSDLDVEKQHSSDGVSFSGSTPTSTPHPFASMGRNTASGVQVSQTRTETEEPIPEYLVHPGFLTQEQLARVEPDSEEARRMQDPVRAAYPGLRGSLDPKN